MERQGDVVVVGGGTAGLACAIAAAEAGARVVVVEKTDDVGGTLHVSTGQLSAAGTRRQRERGIDDSPDRHYDDVMRIGRGTADPALVRRAVDEAAATLDWLEELGLELVPKTPVVYRGHEPYSVARTCWGPRGGRSILAALRPAFEAHVAAGRVGLLLRHRALALLREDGRVAGVRARGPAGELEVRAPATVLATGGYGASRELFARFTPRAPRLVTACPPAATGDGIALAQELGARLRGTQHHLAVVGVLADDPRGFLTLNAAIWPPRAIQVNERGERFLAEDDPSPDRRERALVAQPGQRLFAVFDDASLADGRSFARELTADRVRELAAEGRAGHRAGELDGLARAAGIDAAGLERTVAAWNAAVASGRDPLGVREPGPPVATPPFYAFVVHGAVVATFGGLAVDAELRVLDERGEPVPGLHAIGELLGASATSGDAFCGGMLATPALAFGRSLGRELARHTSRARLV